MRQLTRRIPSGIAMPSVWRVEQVKAGSRNTNKSGKNREEGREKRKQGERERKKKKEDRRVKSVWREPLRREAFV